MPIARTAPELLEYHGRSVVALRVLDGAVDGLVAADRERFPRRREAVLEALEAMRDELDDEVVLAMVAAAERVLRMDFDARLRLGGAQPVAVRFNSLKARFGRHVPLDEIVDVWKDLVPASGECGVFKQIYVYRHGLAHGRYFNWSGRDDIAPRDAAGIVAKLFEKIRNYAADFPRG